LPVQAHGGTTVVVDEGLGGQASVALPIVLENTAGGTIEVKAIFASVARIDKATNPTYQIAMFTVAPEGAAGTPMPIAGTPVTFTLPLNGIDEAGIYAVEVLFGDLAEKHQPYAARAIVHRRESWLRAALAVLLGAALAWGIRVYISDGSRRLALRRRIALLEAHLRVFRAGARDEDMVVAARVLELDVLDRERDVRWGGNMGAIDEVTARAELRFALLQDIALATERLKRIVPEIQVEPRKTLEDALAVVRIDPADRLAIQAARERVGKLGLTALRREQLRGWLADLEAQLAAQDRVATPALTAVKATVASARDLLRTEELDELEAKIRQGREQLLDASIAGLEARTKIAPLGVTGWNATAAQIGAKLERCRTPDWTERNRAFQDAQALYFQVAVAGLITWATQLAAGGDSRAERFCAIAQDLREIAAKDPMLAAARYAELLAEVSAPDPAARGASLRPVGGTVIGGVGTEELLEVEAGAARAGWVPYVPGSLTAGVWQPTEVRTLDRMISSSRWMVNAGVMLIAVATGVKVMWLDNLSWGGHGAWLIAFLWGAGVQLTGDTCAGFLMLRARLAGALPQG